MEVLHPRCAGLDVHKDTVVACVRCVIPPEAHQVRPFATTTSGLLALATGWRATAAPRWRWRPLDLLEAGLASAGGRFELVLGNAQHIRNVSGRKTDVNDATWIAELLAHGLIRSSFVPPAPIQELRDLTRTRKQLVREIAQHALRLQKVLEDANLKVASVLSNILGQSGRAMLAAIIAGAGPGATGRPGARYRPPETPGVGRGPARPGHPAPPGLAADAPGPDRSAGDRGAATGDGPGKSLGADLRRGSTPEDEAERQ